MALLRRHPYPVVMVVDIANVCASGREMAKEQSLGAVLTYHAAGGFAPHESLSDRRLKQESCTLRERLSQCQIPN